MLPKIYLWEKHDDMVGITIKLTGSADTWHYLLDQNKEVLRCNNHRMRPGDIITIPDEIVCNGKKYEEVKVVSNESGTRYRLMARILTDELDIERFGRLKIPNEYRRLE